MKSRFFLGVNDGGYSSSSNKKKTTIGEHETLERKSKDNMSAFEEIPKFQGTLVVHSSQQL